jgi:hypothetical protein
VTTPIATSVPSTKPTTNAISCWLC